MKIREILELNKEMKMPLIAKEHLPIGEKRLYAILKEIGCEPVKGKREWDYSKVVETDLDKDITDFGRVTAKSKPIQKTNKTENKNTKKPEIHDTINSNKQESRESIITESNPTNQIEIRQFEQTTIQETRKLVKKVTYEIDEDLHYEYRMLAFRQKKNVSDLVEQAMREYLENRLK